MRLKIKTQVILVVVILLIIVICCHMTHVGTHSCSKSNLVSKDMETYIRNFQSFNKSIVYDFKLGDGGIGDYIKFFMTILTYCMNNGIRFYHKVNNIEIETYLKIKYDCLNITSDEISKLHNVVIKTPYDYYDSATYDYNTNLYQVFYFDESVKLNVKSILPSLPCTYISIHLRLGDQFLETDRDFVLVKNDKRSFSEEKLNALIESNIDKSVLFFCDNKEYKHRMKEKHTNLIITSSQIGHTSLSNTTSKQILDAVTELYILSNSQLIYAASESGFSRIASKFREIELISMS